MQQQSVLHRTRWSRIVLTLVVLLSTALGGCEDNSLAGERFVLLSLDGYALPAVEFDNGDQRFVVEAETLLFSPNGRGHRSRRVRVEEAGGVTSTTLTGSTDFTYELEGVDVSVTFTCPTNASCVAGPHLVGQRILGKLRVTQRAGESRWMLEYLPLSLPGGAP
jgi:hypothetical protein